MTPNSETPNAVLIFRELQPEEITWIRSLNPVQWGLGTPSGMELPETLQEGYHTFECDLSPEEKLRIQKEILQKTIAFGGIHTSRGYVNAQVQVEEANLWHYHRIRIFDLLREVFWFREELRSAGRNLRK